LIDTNEALVLLQGFVIAGIVCRGGPRAIVAVVVVASGDSLVDGCVPYDGSCTHFWRVWGAEIFDGDGVIALRLFMRSLQDAHRGQYDGEVP